MTPAKHPIGCSQCTDPAAERAWQARQHLKLARVVVEESHYRVTLLRCPDCAQAYASVMTERIDWADGDDPVCRQMIPLSAAESAALERLDDDSVESTIYRIAADGRACLVHDHPKDAEPSISWASGLSRRAHD